MDKQKFYKLAPLLLLFTNIYAGPISKNSSAPILIEGDIAGMTHQQLKDLFEKDNDEINSTAEYLSRFTSEGLVSFKAALKSSKFHWKDAQVPYTVSSSFTAADKAKIRAAMNQMESKTCVRFIPKTSTHDDYISIESKDGCWSYLGKQGGKQIISISKNGCLGKGIIQHELLHAMAFIHEQSRSDRDKFITIVWDNINDDEKGNFQMIDSDRLNLLGSYDYNSVMHYSSKAFTKNGRDTILVKTDGAKIGQRNGLSSKDAQKINKLYCKGQSNCNHLYDTDYGGGDIETLTNVLSADECCAACRRKTECRKYMYNTLNKKCFLKTDETGEYPYKGAITGRIQRYTCNHVENTDFPGHDIERFDNVPTADACCAHCHQRSDCAKYTYNTINKKCFLKASGASEYGYKGAVSGTARRNSNEQLCEDAVNGCYLWKHHNVCDKVPMLRQICRKTCGFC